MLAKFFKDLDKTAEKVLDRDAGWNFDRKLKIKTKTENGVTYTSESTLSSQKGKGVTSKLSAGYKHSSGLQLDKLQVTTDGLIVGEAALAGTVDNTKFYVKAEDSSKGDQKGVIGVEFQHKESPIVNFVGEVDAVVGPTIRANVTTGYENFIVGGKVDYNTQLDSAGISPEFEEYDVALGYYTSDNYLLVQSGKKFEQVTASFHHLLDEDTEVAGRFTYNINSGVQSYVGGGMKQLDGDTKVGFTLNNEAKLSLLWSQKLNKRVKLTACAQVDIRNFEGDSHKFGLALDLGDI